MIVVSWNSFKRIRTKLKKIIREEFDEDLKQHWVDKAVVAGLGFDSVQALFDAVPCRVEWSGQTCADVLCMNGWIRAPEDADQAIDWLEDDLGHLLDLADAPRGSADDLSAGATTQGGSAANL